MSDIPSIYEDTPIDKLPAHKILIQGIMGSHSHGTNIPVEDEAGTDDIDTMSIVLFPTDYYLGIKNYKTRFQVMQGENDRTIYEVRDFVKLLLKQNPNVLSLLWLEQDGYLDLEHNGLKLIRERDIFISAQMYKTYTGYANGQFEKMHQGATDTAYMGAKRKALKQRYGYDPKNAAHLIRLLTMCAETLETGKIQVKRPDAGLLIDIKKGRFSLDDIYTMVKRLKERNDEALAHTTLPKTPNYKRANELLIEIMNAEICGKHLRPECRH